MCIESIEKGNHLICILHRYSHAIMLQRSGTRNAACATSLCYESVVESMASVIGEVFGERRNMNHVSAAEELAIRWNGACLAKADRLLGGIHRRVSAAECHRDVRDEHSRVPTRTHVCPIPTR